jgi:hypothetical protein
MTNYRLPSTLSETDDALLGVRFRDENYREMSPADRLRCHACSFGYFRLWFDRGQCLSCRRYTRIEIGEPENPRQLQLLKGETMEGVMLIPPDFRRVSWIRLSFTRQSDQRVRCLSCGRAEHTVFHSRLICRWCHAEINLEPPVTGSWLLESQSQFRPKINTARDAVRFVSRSTIYRHIRKERDAPPKGRAHHKRPRAA